MRLRLTLVYGGLLLVAGVVLLGVTYVLVSQRLPSSDMIIRSELPGPMPGTVAPTVIQRFATETRDSALNTVLTQGAIALIVVSAAAIALGWLIAGRMLQPLHRITDTARRIAFAPAGGEALHERIALAGPDDEIKRLADTFDLMLARLDQSFDGQRRFIANASHELRTPLTLNRTLLEVALSPPDVPAEVHQLGTTLLAINDRHGRLIDGLLVLAQSEREVTEKSYVDMADVLEHVASGPVVVKADEAPVIGNPVLLERLVQNLVENGLRHNLPSGGWVEVCTGVHEQWVFLQVSNTGPVIPRYEIPGLFEPFRRLGTERLSSPGAGLGLSIVRAVAQAHGGEVHATPREDGGLIVTVTLPRAR